MGLYAPDGSYRVTMVGSEAGAEPVAAGTFNSTPPTLTNGSTESLQLGSRGSLRVELWEGGGPNPIVAGLPNDGLAAGYGVRTVSQNEKFNGTTWDRDRKPNASSRIPSAAASTNATSAKASAGDLHCISGYNAAASVRYLKFYNKASAPTIGTDVPVITLALPATSAFNINLAGHYFATGIAYALTTGAADNDTGALTLADVLGLTITYA